MHRNTSWWKTNMTTEWHHSVISHLSTEMFPLLDFNSLNLNTNVALPDAVSWDLFQTRFFPTLLLELYPHCQFITRYPSHTSEKFHLWNKVLFSSGIQIQSTAAETDFKQFIILLLSLYMWNYWNCIANSGVNNCQRTDCQRIWQREERNRPGDYWKRQFQQRLQ